MDEDHGLLLGEGLDQYGDAIDLGDEVGAKFGWGLWSAGGSYSHESSDTYVIHGLLLHKDLGEQSS